MRPLPSRVRPYGARFVALARERRRGLCDVCATKRLQVAHKLLRLAYFRAKVVALAAQSSMQIRLPGSRRGSVSASGQERVFRSGRFGVD
jgi:hypothetical protein